MAQIVMVDDEQYMLDASVRILRKQNRDWDTRTFNSGRDAWAHLQCNEADVVLTDLCMPGMSGMELVRRLRGQDVTRDTPIVVLTGSQNIEEKSQALDIGATDLLSKPIHPVDLIARIRNALRLKSCQDRLKLRNSELEQIVHERTLELQASRREIIWRLSRAAEFRDENTGLHVVRVAEYSRVLALQIGQSPEFAETLFLAAPLHDVGKIGISDLILFKCGPLTEVERKLMQNHCMIGEQILQGTPQSRRGKWNHHSNIGDEEVEIEPDPVLRMAQTVAATHHERWDGGGYPRGLAGEEIPLAGRIVAVADVYDALTSERSYKRSCSSTAAVEMMQPDCGRHFDPRVFAAFLESLPEIENLRSSYAEPR